MAAAYRSSGAPWATLLIVSLGVMMADVQWVTNGYLLALAGFLIPTGRLGDRFGHRETFLIGVAGFTLCSTGIGLSGHIGLVIALRVLQGLSGALLTPAALGLLRATFSTERLPVALGVCAAMFCLVWPLIKAGQLRRGDLGTWLVLVVAAVLFALFVVRERKAHEPVLPLRLFRSRSLAADTAPAVLMAFALIGGLFFITFYLQNVHGLGPEDSGLRLLPLTAIMIVAAPPAGQLVSRLGPRLPMLVGMLITSAALFGPGRLTADSIRTKAAIDLIYEQG